jgi:hypothetical protein
LNLIFVSVQGSFSGWAVKWIVEKWVLLMKKKTVKYYTKIYNNQTKDQLNINEKYHKSNSAILGKKIDLHLRNSNQFMIF